MALWDQVMQFLALEPMAERSIDTFDTTTPLATKLAAIQGQARPWRLPSITEALGVPAIQRAVTLISNTAGSLAIEAYRNGALLPETPRVIARPDPFSTPRDSYGSMTYCLATRGETVLWIATRDALDFPSALIVVPLNELTVEENPRNRMLPQYTWQDKKGTRYSPANPNGDFVHIFYLREPLALRGKGPLQLAGAASSVSVESQEWAANFYAAGGNPSVNLHSELELEPEEADALRNQWIATPSNMPQVTSGSLTLRDVPSNPQGAQMLEAREYQNGDAARMFGIPGRLMEYSSPGSSLTYQNLSEVWTDFVRGCLAPNYLEPIEQALSDILPRSTMVRFHRDVLLQADIKTRFDVYGVAIDKGIMTTEQVQVKEGILPGDIETAPVLASPLSAVPAPLQKRSAEVRCDGMRLLRGRLTRCNKLLAESGPFTGTCPRCERTYRAEAEPVVRAALVPVPALRPVTRPAPPEPAPQPVDLEPVWLAIRSLEERDSRPAPAPQMTIAEGAVQVHLTLPPTVIEPSRIDIAPTIVGEDQLARFDAGIRSLHDGDASLREVITESSRAIVQKITERPRARRLEVQRDPSGRIVSGVIEEIAEAG